MACVGTGSKPATSVEVVTGYKKPSEKHKVCYLLERIPREIRDQIWREMFVRPTGIVPGYVHFDVFDRGDRDWHRRFYRYHWDDHRRRIYTSGLPGPLAPNPTQFQTFHVSITTKPTPDQQKLIDNDATELPPIIDQETGTKIEQLIHRYQDGLVEIIHRKQVSVKGFGDIKVAATCKQINAEVLPFLYGANTFVFDARDRACTRSAMNQSPSQIEEFNDLRYRIPGLPDKAGNPPSQRRITKGINTLFDKESYQPTFIFEDPFLRFCHQVGRKNMRLIKKVEIEGHFKILQRLEGDESPIGLGWLLPIYTVVLNHVCKNLQSLTLHVGEGRNMLYMGSGKAWRYWEMCWSPYLDDDVMGEEGREDEGKIENAVRKVVEGLPGLRHLQLGDYKTPGIGEYDLKWGTSVRWMEFVEYRTRSLGEEAKGICLESDGQNNEMEKYRGLPGNAKGRNDTGRERGREIGNGGGRSGYRSYGSRRS